MRLAFALLVPLAVFAVACGGDDPLPPVLEPPEIVRAAPGGLPDSGCFAADDDLLPLGFRAAGVAGHALVGIRPDGERVRLHRFFLGRGRTPLVVRVLDAPDVLAAFAIREGGFGLEVELVVVAPDGAVRREQWVSGSTPPEPWGGVAPGGRGYLSWPLRNVDGAPTFAVFDSAGGFRTLPPGALPVAAPDAAGRVPVQQIDPESDDGDLVLAGFLDPGTLELTPLRFPAETWSPHGPDGRARYFFSSGGEWARVLESADGTFEVLELGLPSTQVLALRGQEPRFVVFGDQRPQVLVDAVADERVALPADDAGVDARVRSSGPGDVGPWYLYGRGSVPLVAVELGAGEPPVDLGGLVFPDGVGPVDGRCSESNGITDDGRVAALLAGDGDGRVWLEAPELDAGWRPLGRPLVDPDFVRMHFVAGRFFFFAGTDVGGRCRFPWPTSALTNDGPEVLRGVSVQVGSVADGVTWARSLGPGGARGEGAIAVPSGDLRCALVREPDFLRDPAGALEASTTAELVDIETGAVLVLDGLRDTTVFPVR